jgi:hypothetical protein
MVVVFLFVIRPVIGVLLGMPGRVCQVIFKQKGPGAYYTPDPQTSNWGVSISVAWQS